MIFTFLSGDQVGSNCETNVEVENLVTHSLLSTLIGTISIVCALCILMEEVRMQN